MGDYVEAEVAVLWTCPACSVENSIEVSGPEAWPDDYEFEECSACGKFVTLSVPNRSFDW